MQSNETKALVPRIHPSVFIAEGARIYGDVEIKKGASVWFNAVIRGDEGSVTIGENTNIQDNVVVHSDAGAIVVIGDNVTVGHSAVVRGARIGNHVSIGMNATIMSYADIGDYSVVGANAFVAYHKKFPEKSLITGVPARLIRSLEGDMLNASQIAVDIYLDLVKQYTSGRIVGHNGKEKTIKRTHAMLLLTYTPRKGIDLEQYHQWLQDVDNPFFNSRPGVQHYSNWRVKEDKLGKSSFTHFDLLYIKDLNGFEEVFGDQAVDEFARGWVRLWGENPDPDAPDQSVNYHVYLCEQIAGPE